MDEELSLKKKKSPVNKVPREKKKVPPKPWGKKERIIVLVLLIATAGISAALALSAREWKLPGLPRLALKMPSITFLKGEKIILEGEGNYEYDMKEGEVIEFFKGETSKLSGVYGFYLSDLQSGFSTGYLDDEIFQAASMIKLPVMAGLYMEEEVGNIDLDEKYRLKSSDKVSGAGSLYDKPVGYEITYRNLIRLMGKQSDNTAFNIARKKLGDDKVNEIITKIGMTKTSLRNNETTPSDIGVFFEGLWNGNIINKANSDELLSFMTDTSYENWLVEGISASIRVSHKFGAETNVINDGGIIFAERPFVLILMSKGVVKKEADSVFPVLSKEIFDIWTR